MARSPALVGAEHRRLELLLGHGLDRLQRQAHLLAHGAEAGADGTRIGDASRLLLLIFLKYLDALVNQ